MANFLSSISVDGSITLGTSSLSTNELDVSSGAFKLDVAADITLDAGGQDIILSDDGTIFGTFSNSSGFQIRSRIDDADMFLRGVDNGTEFNALRLDMSDAGWAHFNSGIAVGGGVNAISTFEGTVDVNGAVSTFGAGGTGTGDAVVSIDGGSGTGGEAYLRLTRGGSSGFILNHTATSIEHRATANIPQRFYTNDTLTLTLGASQDATFAGSLSASISADSDSTYTGIVVSESGLLKYRTKAQIRSDIGAGTGDGTITTVASGAGLQGGATSGIATLSVDYAGTDNYILATPYGSETPVGADTIAFVDSDNNVHSATISDLPFSNNSGTVTSVAVTVGTGLDVSGSPITSSGTIDIDLDLTEITVGAGLDTTATGISLDLSELASATGAMGSSDRFVLSSSGGSNRKSTPSLIGLSLFNNDAGFTTNSGTVTGTGSSGRIAIWNSSTGLTSDSDLQWNSSSNKLIFESDYSISDNNGDFELNHDDSDINTTLKGFGGNGALKIQENSIFTSASGFYVPSGYGISAGTTATASGTIRATGNIVAYYSDERLKDFKGNIPDALDKVCQLNGYYYTQNDKAAELGYENYERQVGVSAQEVEKVMPEVVETAPISYDNDDDYLTVDYGRLVPLLIESIKELKNEIEILKSKSCGN